jgi:hypothetical protein
VHKGQHQVSVDRTPIDQSIGQQANAAARSNGQLDINFHNAPPKMKVKGNGKGVFENMKITQTTQMAKTGQEDSAGVNAEE